MAPLRLLLLLKRSRVLLCTISATFRKTITDALLLHVAFGPLSRRIWMHFGMEAGLASLIFHGSTPTFNDFLF
jgi:hypothetical protein